MFGGGIGDVVKRSAIAGLVEDYLSEYEVHYLSPYDLPIPGAAERHIFNYTKAKVNPWYYFSLANDFRGIGFEKIIVLLPFCEGFLSFLGTDMGARIVYCDDMQPPDGFSRFMQHLNTLIHHRAVKRNIKLISVENGWDKGWSKKYFPSDAWRHLSLVSKAIKDIKPDLKMENRFLLPTSFPPKTALELPEDPEVSYLDAIHKKYDLTAKKYCVIGLGSSSEEKDWPAENFAMVADFLWSRGMRTVVIGTRDDADRKLAFKAKCRADYVIW